MPTPQEQHEAELLASQLEALARTSLHAASSLRSLHDRSKVNYRLLHIRIGRVLEHAPESAVCRAVDRQPIAQEAYAMAYFTNRLHEALAKLADTDEAIGDLMRCEESATDPLTAARDHTRAATALLEALEVAP